MYHKLDIFTFQWKCCRELSVRTLGRLWFARHRFVNIEKGSANDTFTIVSSVTLLIQSLGESKFMISSFAHKSVSPLVIVIFHLCELSECVLRFYAYGVPWNTSTISFHFDVRFCLTLHHRPASTSDHFVPTTTTSLVDWPVSQGRLLFGAHLTLSRSLSHSLILSGHFFW